MRKAFVGTGFVVGGLVVDALLRGQLTLDTGLGRSVRPLGPLRFEFEADRETVFDIIAVPYSTKAPRALKDKVSVLERGEGMVLAAHRTQVRPGLETVTVETVRFDRPTRIDFRLVRGPVPHVVETFELGERDGETTLLYTGEMGADFWTLGQWWADRVAGKWEAAVSASMQAVAQEAARRSQRRL